MSEKIRVMTVLGTRPEAIKLAPVIQRFNSDNRFESTLVVTAQHREMLDQVLSLYKLIPHEDLDLMTAKPVTGKTHRGYLHPPDPMLEKYTRMGGGAGRHPPPWLPPWPPLPRIKVAHVEAGLRTRIMAAFPRRDQP